jgi:hypothetical protein
MAAPQTAVTRLIWSDTFCLKRKLAEIYLGGNTAKPVGFYAKSLPYPFLLVFTE